MSPQTKIRFGYNDLSLVPSLGWGKGGLTTNMSQLVYEYDKKTIEFLYKINGIYFLLQDKIT